MEWLKFKQPIRQSDIHSSIPPFPTGQIELWRMEVSKRERKEEWLLLILLSKAEVDWQSLPEGNLSQSESTSDSVESFCTFILSWWCFVCMWTARRCFAKSDLEVILICNPVLSVAYNDCCHYEGCTIDQWFSPLTRDSWNCSLKCEILHSVVVFVLKWIQIVWQLGMFLP